MATGGVLTKNGSVNTADLTVALRHLYDSYQRLIKSARVPRSVFTPTQGMARINAEKTFLLASAICTTSPEYRPSDDRTQDILRDIPDIGRLDETGGQVSPIDWNPMMIGRSESLILPVTLNQTFTAMTCILSVHHQAGKMPFRYPWTVFVSPGTISHKAIQGAISRSSQRVIFSEATDRGVAYGAIAYLTRTFPRRALMVVFLPAKQGTPGQAMSAMTEDAIDHAVGAAVARWSEISSRIFRDEVMNPVLSNEDALKAKVPLFVKHGVSGAPVSVWFPLVRFSLESDSFQVLSEAEILSKQVERTAVMGGAFGGDDSLDDDLSPIEDAAMSEIDKAHYRWVRSILYLRLPPYFHARSHTIGTLPRAPVFTEEETREILIVNGKIPTEE